MREPTLEVGIGNPARMLALVGVAVAIPVEEASAQAPADVEIGVENIKITAIEVGELANEPLDLIE